MAYADKKEHDGRSYAGMRVGGVHRWSYPDGAWHKRKMEPSRWEFSFASTKKRKTKAPPGSGAGVGSGYPWYILAHQWARKLDADHYATFMEGEKHLLGFQKPEWSSWNTQFRHQPDARHKAIEVLREALAALEEEEGSPEEPWQMPQFGRWVSPRQRPTCCAPWCLTTCCVADAHFILRNPR